MRQVTYNDPSPSRIRYRFERIWLKPLVRKFVRLWLPIIVFSWIIGALSVDPVVRASVSERMDALRDIIAARPELAVETVEFNGATEDLQAQMMAITGVTLPVSSLDLDVVALKNTLETLDAVQSVDVRVVSGVLQITAVERSPMVVWRDGETLRLIDDEGNRVAVIARRSARVDLPLIVGVGAELNAAEAIALMDVAAPIKGRLRGFVRVGERRWDMVLDRGQTIMLPEVGAITAMRRIMALHLAQDLLSRDVSVIDMRNGERPVLRLTDNAVSELRRMRILVRGEEA